MYKWLMIDFLSCEPKLFVYNNDRYITKFGVIISYICLTIITVLSGYFLYNFYQKEGINIVFLRNNDFVADVELTKDFFFYRYYDVENDVIDPRVAKVVPTFIKIWANDSFEINDITTETCSFDSPYLSKHKELFNNLNISKYTCVVPGDYNILATFNVSSYFNFYIAKCQNTTENGNHCYDPSYIDSYLEGLNMYYEYYSPSYIVDHYSVDKPLRMGFNYQQYRIISDFFYAYTERYKIIKYISDEGVVFEDPQTHNGYEYDDSSSNIVIYNNGIPTLVDNSFALIQYNINNRFMEQYQRTYQKLQDVVANIGGIVDFVRLVGEIVGSYITLQKFFIDMSNHIVRYDKPDSDPELKKHIKVQPLDKESRELKDKSTKENKGDTPDNISENRMIKPPPRIKPKKKLRFWEAIIPVCISTKASPKKYVNVCEEIIKSKLSCEHLLEFSNEFDRFKQLIFDEAQYKLFKYVNYPTVKEHLNPDIKCNEEYENLMTLDTDNIITNRIKSLTE
jgi:hypothetical protein